MDKQSLAKAFQSMRVAVSKHSPEILTGLGIAGMITTTILAVKATPKALILLEEKKADEEVDKLIPIETVKTAWKPYIPAAVTGTASIACLIGASSVNVRRNAALATAYKLSEKAFTEYREKAIETIGEKKEHRIREKVAEERVKNNPVSKAEVILTEKGQTLFYEPLSDRWFKSDIEAVRRAEIRLNQSIQQGISNSASLNDFYDELGLHHTQTTGDILGWNAFHLIKLDLDPHITEDDKQFIWIGHYNPPKYDY